MFRHGHLSLFVKLHARGYLAMKLYDSGNLISLHTEKRTSTVHYQIKQNRADRSPTCRGLRQYLSPKSVLTPDTVRAVVDGCQAVGLTSRSSFIICSLPVGIDPARSSGRIARPRFWASRVGHHSARSAPAPLFGANVALENRDYSAHSPIWRKRGTRKSRLETKTENEASSALLARLW